MNSYEDELKRQSEMMAQAKVGQPPNALGVDPAAAQSFGQALTGQPNTAPVMMDTRDLGQAPAEQETLIAKLKALMGQGQ